MVGSAFIGLVVAGALGGTPAFAAALTLYVGGPGCSDAGSGTASQPYCTIGKAASVATAGQTPKASNTTPTEST